MGGGLMDRYQIMPPLSVEEYEALRAAVTTHFDGAEAKIAETEDGDASR